MHRMRFDRRSLMKFTGAGLSGSVVASSGSRGDDGPLRAQLDEAATATERYADPQAAIDDGFVVLGPYVPDMGWHFLHPDRLGTLDVSAPQLLTYDDVGERLELGAVEYAIPVGAGGTDAETPPDLFDDDGADAEENWHVHPGAEHVLAVPPPDEEQELPAPEELNLDDQLRTSRWVEVVLGADTGEPMFEPGMTIVADFAAGGGLDSRAVVDSLVHPDLWTLHAWVHLENPDGVFVESNRALANSPPP